MFLINETHHETIGGASNLNQGGRRPVAEVREPDSDFQLPDPPFRAQFNPNANPSFTNFNQQEQQQQPSPQRPLRTNNGNNPQPIEYCAILEAIQGQVVL